MGKLFNLDSPVMQGLSRICDLVVLNVLTVLLSLPIVTLGAASAALYDGVYRIHLDEGGVYRAYFQAFKSNFKQATALWLILLAAALLVGCALLFYLQMEGLVGSILAFLAVVLAVLWCAVFSWAFPLQSRFENSVPNTLRNAMLCGIAYLPRTLILIVLNMTPVFLLLLFPAVFLQISIAWVLIWFALAAYLNLLALKKPLQKLMEPAE